MGPGFGDPTPFGCVRLELFRIDTDHVKSSNLLIGRKYVVAD